jgi:hypothetical protein
MESLLRLVILWFRQAVVRVQSLRTLEVQISLRVLRHRFIKLSPRLRDLILHVFPADMCKNQALFRIVSGSDITKPPVCSTHLRYVRYIPRRAKG